MAQLVLLIAIPASFLLLPLTPPFLLACGVLVLLPVFPVLRSLHLLLALGGPWLLLLSAVLNFLTSLLWRGWG